MGRVIDVLQRLRDAGNTLVVVEHDPEIMLAADKLLDMGPGPGERGGEIVFFGSPDELKGASTLTAEYLSGRKRADDALPSEELQVPGVEVPNNLAKDPMRGAAILGIRGATEHNLKDIDVEIPLRRFVCVTGVSGSGKSTLVQDVLLSGASQAPREAHGNAGRVHAPSRARGTSNDIVIVDQSPIGRTTRSNPASYVGAFDEIRTLFARPRFAHARLHDGHLQLQLRRRPVPHLHGNGFEHVEMQFLSDVYLRCPDCNGSRYRDEVLEVKVARQHASPTCSRSRSPRRSPCSRKSEVVRCLEPLLDVGLDYLHLGQPVPTSPAAKRSA